MKTKDNDNKSGSADRRFCGLRLFPDPRAADRKYGGPRYAIWQEQSGNVDENKAQGQEVGELESES